MPHFDLIIVGTGSGNSIPGPEFDHWKIAIVEEDRFGGTCLNAGCIPTKMFVHPAELADAPRHGRPLGITSTLQKADWPGMRERIFGRIDAMERDGRRYRMESENVDVFAGIARFTGPRELCVALHDGGTLRLTGERIVLAAGAHPNIPGIPGLDLQEIGQSVHTSDTIMRIADLPASIAILGGGYIAAEFAHIFASFGTRVSQIVRGKRLLKSLDEDISRQFTKEAAARYSLKLRTTVDGLREVRSGVELDLNGPEGPGTLTAELLLVATGRRSNAVRLNVGATGVDVDGHGRVKVNARQETTAPNIFALGDICAPQQLKHVANHQARVVKHNLAHPESPQFADSRFVPAAVFADPQIASVGLTEKQARERGIAHVSYTQKYADIAAGWAREDSGHFLKVLACPETGLLLGAHIIGPEAATVIQPLIQAMHFSQPAHAVARGQYWIHPALSELVENALLGLPAPVPPS